MKWGGYWPDMGDLQRKVSQGHRTRCWDTEKGTKDWRKAKLSQALLSWTGLTWQKVLQGSTRVAPDLEPYFFRVQKRRQKGPFPGF